MIEEKIKALAQLPRKELDRMHSETCVRGGNTQTSLEWLKDIKDKLKPEAYKQMVDNYNSVIKELPQLGYVMLLMFIIFYIYAAIGTTFFASINPSLWGDIAISLLTLFRVMTFEDWTDVMYETMTVYSLSWFYYLTFIFFTAFAFLNMVIGIVVNVLEQERQLEADLLNKDSEEPTLSELKQELAEIKALLQK